MISPGTMQKHFAGAALAGLVLRLFFIWQFPAEAGDTRVYEALALNWLDHGVYGLYLGGQLTPVDIRAPGYPAFLAAIYLMFGRTRWPVLLAQALLDLATCGLTAALAARLAAPPAARAPVAAAALWLAALCPFTANYAAVPLSEVLATFFTTLALWLLLGAFASAPEGTGCFGTAAQARRLCHRLCHQGGAWFPGGFVVGLGTLVRPETPLVLMALGLVLAWRWRRPPSWPGLVRACVWMAAGLCLPLLPWAARNWHTLGRVQLLAPRYAELAGEFVPRGFYAWTKTWLVRFRDAYLVVWKLEEKRIRIEDLPGAAFDSEQERARVAELLERYNFALYVSPELDSEFSRLAAERAARHPLRTWLVIPLERAVVVWFTPRIELLPYSGHLWPPGQKWQEDPVDFSVTVGLWLVNCAYLSLALAGAWRARRQPGLAPTVSELALVVVFLVLRTALLTQLETPEPRYTQVCFPAVVALAAQVWCKARATTVP
jgi:hypothetical protein